MSAFNICLVKPDNYIHSLAFLELGELLHYSLQELGLKASLQFNSIDASARNILIGCHLLDPNVKDRLPKSTIILNTEQISSDSKGWNEYIFEWSKHFEFWDYSTRNIQKFKEAGIEGVKHLKIGFQKELVRIEKCATQDIDVLFYGSINDRRKKIIDGLREKGLKVQTLFGVYGKERDQWIGRSRVVLNHHFYNAQIFEIIRVFYLLTNSITVVGEVNETTAIDETYRNAIRPCAYDQLVSGCIELVSDNAARKRQEDEAYAVFSRLPQTLYTAEIIES